jgi:putative tricarboxylic transport membrane protein
VRRAVIIIGVCALTLDAVYLAEALRYPLGTPARPGAAFYPLLVGGVVAASALATIIEEYRAGSAPATAGPEPSGLRRVIILAATAASYVVLLPYVGHLLASIPVTVIALRIMGLRSWPALALVAAFLVLGTYYLFGVLLMVPFPAGILGGP